MIFSYRKSLLCIYPDKKVFQHDTGRTPRSVSSITRGGEWPTGHDLTDRRHQTDECWTRRTNTYGNRESTHTFFRLCLVIGLSESVTHPPGSCTFAYRHETIPDIPKGYRCWRSERTLVPAPTFPMWKEIPRAVKKMTRATEVLNVDRPQVRRGI